MASFRVCFLCLLGVDQEQVASIILPSGLAPDSQTLDILKARLGLQTGDSECIVL